VDGARGPTSRHRPMAREFTVVSLASLRSRPHASLICLLLLRCSLQTDLLTRTRLLCSALRPPHSSLPHSLMSQRRSANRFDSALPTEDDTTPGAMHELESDGEDDEGGQKEGEAEEEEEEVHIEEDDIDDPRSPAAPMNPPPAPQSALQTLPSYQSLMSSLSASKMTPDDDRAGVGSNRSSTSSLSLSPDSDLTSRYPGDSDENHGFLEDDADVGSDDSEDDADAKLTGGAGRVYSFEEMFSRAQRLETKGFLRKAASYYLYCLEHYRYSHQHQDLIAMCLRRLGDICYKNKKCQCDEHRSLLATHECGECIACAGSS
jgi:hypothetical protein